MDINLSTETQKLIQDHVQRGAYTSADEVVRAGLASLEQQAAVGDFRPRELDGLLAEGEAGGPDLDGEQVLKELAELRARSGGAK